MTVGTITDDKRLFEVPTVRVAALRVTDAARARILKVPIAGRPRVSHLARPTPAAVLQHNFSPEQVFTWFAADASQLIVLADHPRVADVGLCAVCSWVQSLTHDSCN